MDVKHAVCWWNVAFTEAHEDYQQEEWHVARTYCPCQVFAALILALCWEVIGWLNQKHRREMKQQAKDPFS